MSQNEERAMNKAVDTIQQRLTDFACELTYESLPPETVHAAKVRIIDTLGALLGGFFAEPCHIARDVAAQVPNAGGATVIGTRMKTTPDMAAFVNAIAARFLEANDVYNYPGASHGHPSDCVMPVLAVAEHLEASGRDFITSVVLAYEVFMCVAEAIHMVFDSTNFSCLGSAVGAGKIMGLSRDELAHCISMAVVPNNSLNQTRFSQMSMWKAGAAGQAGRAGVFAALLARAGMEGPHLPFEGKAGWCDHVAGKRFALDKLGDNGRHYRVQDSWIKMRFCAAPPISSILAAEKIAPALNSIKDVKHVTVEADKRAALSRGVGAEMFNPRSRETADHSIPYCVAVALTEGTVTQRSFDDAHLRNPELHALMQKIEVLPNDEFTRLYEFSPAVVCARVTVETHGGERLLGESGTSNDGLSAPRTDAEIEQKFRGLAEELLGAKQVNGILDRLWHLEDLRPAEIPAAFILAE